MKKILLSLMAIALSIGVYAQPISDNAIIPISVSLNSILRLNVTSGGNIDFQINSIDQFTNGISNGPRYTTTFTVASSIDYDVLMYAEGASLIGSDLSTHTMLVGNIGYVIECTGTAVVAAAGDILLNGLVADPAVIAALNNLPATEIVSSIPTPAGTGGAGDIAKNKFEIRWELATAAARGVSTLGTLLSQNLNPDRYSTSVFLALKAHD